MVLWHHLRVERRDDDMRRIEKWKKFCVEERKLCKHARKTIAKTRQRRRKSSCQRKRWKSDEILYFLAHESILSSNSTSDDDIARMFVKEVSGKDRKTQEECGGVVSTFNHNTHCDSEGKSFDIFSQWYFKRRKISIFLLFLWFVSTSVDRHIYRSQEDPWLDSNDNNNNHQRINEQSFCASRIPQFIAGAPSNSYSQLENSLCPKQEKKLRFSLLHLSHDKLFWICRNYNGNIIVILDKKEIIENFSSKYPDIRRSFVHPHKTQVPELKSEKLEMLWLTMVHSWNLLHGSMRCKASWKLQEGSECT